jgi:hypothetical protein
MNLINKLNQRFVSFVLSTRIVRKHVRHQQNIGLLVGMIFVMSMAVVYVTINL